MKNIRFVLKEIAMLTATAVMTTTSLGAAEEETTEISFKGNGPKTTIEASVDSESLGVNNVSDEEAIANLQAEQMTKRNEFLEQIQDENIKRMYTLLYKIADEPVEKHQMTEQELKNEINKIYKKCSQFVVIDDSKNTLSFAKRLLSFNELPDKEKNLTIDEYYNTNAYDEMKGFMETGVAINAFQARQGLPPEWNCNLFSSNADCVELIDLMTEEAAKAVEEFHNGNLDGPHYKTIFELIKQAKKSLRGREELMGIILIPERYVCMELFDTMSNTSVGKYLDRRDCTIRSVPETDNPTVEEQRIFDIKEMYDSWDFLLKDTVEIMMGIKLNDTQF